MRIDIGLALTLFCTPLLFAQAGQLNTIESALNVNAPALTAFLNQGSAPPPLHVALVTDSPLTINLRAQANTPVVLIWAGGVNGSSTNIGAFSGFPDVQIDVADQGALGYADQALVDGYTRPWPDTFTDSSGDWSLCTSLSACTTSGGATTCITPSNFDVTLQGLVVASNPPINIRATGAVVGNFLNGYAAYDFSGPAGDESALHVFRDGFTFSFYGTTYSQFFISENGFIQFGSAASIGGFANPSLAIVNNAPPRIMSYYSDLDPNISPGGTIFVRQTESKTGARQVSIIHRDIEEFGGATGPHGGTITLNETGEIAILVASSNQSPSINTLVGISPGGAPLSSFPSPTFGRDLSPAIGSGLALGAGVPGFEFFDEGSALPLNPLDLAGLNQFNGTAFGPGIVYLPDLTLAPPQSGYIIQ